ncbi:hypothetical protein PAP18089_01370 [Pandoraea apista]|uniref:Uncharacterized protein n=1 Tax=Pandoraea apista TaxID=93218 RepID=A0A5E5P257_9BURK|nr:hypothetical protein PAP18089_01370 [Pandoraea apista]
MRLKQHGDTRRNGPPGGRTPARDRVRTGFTDHCASRVALCQASLNRRVRKRLTSRMDRRTTGEPCTHVGVRAHGVRARSFRCSAPWVEGIGFDGGARRPARFTAVSRCRRRPSACWRARGPRAARPCRLGKTYGSCEGAAVLWSGVCNARGQCIVVAVPNNGQATDGLIAAAESRRHGSAGPWPKRTSTEERRPP